MQETGTIFIYVLKHPMTHEVHYVGKTNDPRIRKKGHRNLRGTTRCDVWKRDLRAQELEPILEIIEKCSPKMWRKRERYWIARYRAEGCDLMNITEGGGGNLPSNHVVSQSTRQLLRERFKGRPILPEQRMQISKSLTGKKQSPETVAKRKATINANRLTKGHEPWNFGNDEIVRKRKNRERYDRHAREAGKPIRFSPEWAKKRLDSFNATLATLTPEQKAQRAAHLNDGTRTPYWLGKKRGPQSPETIEKRRQGMLRMVEAKRSRGETWPLNTFPKGEWDRRSLFQKGHTIGLGEKRGPLSPETKEKIRQAWVGKKAHPQSPETREKIRQGMLRVRAEMAKKRGGIIP